MKEKIQVFLIVVLIVFVIAGCQNEVGKENADPEIYSYQMGETEISEYGDTFSFQPEGIMGVPKGDKLPIMLILHGAYREVKMEETEYDESFQLMVSSFAKKGYFTIAIDVSQAYQDPDRNNQMYHVMGILVHHMKSFVNANMGKKLFDIDLRNKLDFKKLSVLGHESGGEAALYFADDLVRQNIYIKSLIMVEPTSEYLTDNMYYDVPTTVVVSNEGELDRTIVELFMTSFSDAARKFPFYIISLESSKSCLEDENLMKLIEYTDSFSREYLYPEADYTGTSEIEKKILYQYQPRRRWR